MTLSLDSPLLRIFLTVSFFAALSLVRTKDVDIPYLYKISCWHYWYVWNWQQHILYSSVSAACGYSPSDKCSHWVLWKRYARWRRLIFFETDRTVTYPNRFLFGTGSGYQAEFSHLVMMFWYCFKYSILYFVNHPSPERWRSLLLLCLKINGLEIIEFGFLFNNLNTSGVATY